MTMCIGQFGGGWGTWYMELHWLDGVGRIFERVVGGAQLVGMAYLDRAMFPLDPDGDSELDPRTDHAKRVMILANAKAAHEALTSIERMCDAAGRGTPAADRDAAIESYRDLVTDVVAVCREALKFAVVPQPEEQWNIDAMKVKA